MKFQVGDHIIGRPEADDAYGITAQNTHWVVLEVFPFHFSTTPGWDQSFLREYDIFVLPHPYNTKAFLKNEDEFQKFYNREFLTYTFSKSDHPRRNTYHVHSDFFDFVGRMNLGLSNRQLTHYLLKD